jgi:integrase
MRKTLTDRAVAALKARAKPYAQPDPELAGHYVRVQPSGAKSYCAVVRAPSSKQIWTTISSTEVLPITESRLRAREIIRRVKDGLPAVEPKAETFAAVANEWLERHVRKKGLRSAPEYERLLDRYILPLWKDREFISIRRSDIAALLDKIEDRNGERQADYCLAVIRGLMNWAASRRDDYTPPVQRGMRRQSPKAQARARILTDDEVKAVWAAADGAFGGMVKLALLTAQRRDKVVGMRWQDIKDGVWTIPSDPREKGNAGAIALPRLALEVIEAQPGFADNPFVFAGRGADQMSGFSKMKARLDRRSAVTDWTLHDLRRTARSLMSRAGVISDHAERVLGHAIGGVEEVYDRHAYREEKRIALAKLATLIDNMVNPRENVIPLAASAEPASVNDGKRR